MYYEDRLQGARLWPCAAVRRASVGRRGRRSIRRAASKSVSPRRWKPSIRAARCASSTALPRSPAFPRHGRTPRRRAAARRRRRPQRDYDEPRPPGRSTTRRRPHLARRYGRRCGRRRRSSTYRACCTTRAATPSSRCGVARRVGGRQAARGRGEGARERRYEADCRRVGRAPARPTTSSTAGHFRGPSSSTVFEARCPPKCGSRPSARISTKRIVRLSSPSRWSRAASTT